MNRRIELASKYIRGKGIEIGALHQPLQIPASADVKYIDRLNKNDLLYHYPELSSLPIVSPDIIDDAEDLNKIEDSKYDFCICNHLLEHLADPICALKNWIRILKPGGILYVAVPDISNQLDTGRELTTLEHLIGDNTEKDIDKDYKHFVECAKYWNKIIDVNDIDKIAKKNWNMNYSIHYHTFNKDSVRQLFSHMAFILEDKFQVMESVEGDINGAKEYIYIIEKTDYVYPIDKIEQTSQENVSLYTRLLHCIEENGLTYTIKRTIIYFRNMLYTSILKKKI